MRIVLPKPGTNAKMRKSRPNQPTARENHDHQPFPALDQQAFTLAEKTGILEYEECYETVYTKNRGKVRI